MISKVRKNMLIRSIAISFGSVSFSIARTNLNVGHYIADHKSLLATFSVPERIVQ